MLWPEIIASKALEVLSKATAETESFWSNVRLIFELPRAFEQLKQHLSSGGLGFYNYVQHPLAYAFVLTMNGNPQAAEKEFRNYGSHTPESVRQKLHALLTETAQTHI